MLETGKKKVGLLGFSFKAGTDDLRESPIVILAEALLGKGISLCIYDKNVSLARLVGANKEYIEKQIPHLSSLLCNTIDEVIDQSEVIVVGNQAPEFADAVKQCRADQIVIDLVRLPIYGVGDSRPTTAASAGNARPCSSATKTPPSIARAWSGGSGRSRPSPAPSSSASRADGCASASRARSSASAPGGSSMCWRFASTTG